MFPVRESIMKFLTSKTSLIQMRYEQKNIRFKKLYHNNRRTYTTRIIFPFMVYQRGRSPRLKTWYYEGDVCLRNVFNIGDTKVKLNPVYIYFQKFLYYSLYMHLRTFLKLRPFSQAQKNTK